MNQLALKAVDFAVVFVLTVINSAQVALADTLVDLEGCWANEDRDAAGHLIGSLKICFRRSGEGYVAAFGHGHGQGDPATWSVPAREILAITYFGGDAPCGYQLTDTKDQLVLENCRLRGRYTLKCKTVDASGVCPKF